MFAHVIQWEARAPKGKEYAQSHSSSACVLAHALVGSPSAPTECLTNQFPLIYAIC